ncbi:MAG TPA: hypothetical protein VM533_09075 [Fimbriiglobus sp.]|jgi:hypothetical protein|nr:hypothetical protein [Fimbriiglobus sp.]
MSGDPFDRRPIDTHGPTPLLYRTFVEPPFLHGGDGRHAAICPLTGRTAVVEPADLQLLGVCRTFAPLDIHARRGCLALGYPLDHEGWLCDRLAALTASGLLVPYGQIQALLDASIPSTPAPVTVIGIPTRDRPDMLARSAADLARSARDAYRSVELVVADGSARPESRAANRRVLEELRDTFPGEVRYIGATERERYVVELIRAGADPDAARFALLPDESLFAAGANRNLLALHAAGRVLLQMDDDGFSRTAAVPDARTGLAFTSHPDPTEFWFLPGVPTDGELGAPADVAGIHEALLGRGLADSLAAVPAGSVDLDGADAPFFLRLRAAGGRVRVTTAGVAGDSGMGTAAYYLMLRGASRDRLHSSEDVYRAAVSGGPVVRAVTRPTVTAGSVCMAGNLGLDLRSPLPPFPPVLRNEDGVFGAIVQTCCPSAFMGHLPAAVWHLSPGPRTNSPGLLDRWTDGIRSEHLLIALVRACAPAAPSTDERRNLRILGEGLAGLSSLPAGEFRAMIRATAWDLMAGMAGQLTGLLEEYGEEPMWWANDVKRLTTRLRDQATVEHYGVPTDLRSGANPDEALDRFRGLVGRYGHLLTHWHDLAETAADLRFQGVVPAQ